MWIWISLFIVVGFWGSLAAGHVGGHYLYLICKCQNIFGGLRKNYLESPPPTTQPLFQGWHGIASLLPPPPPPAKKNLDSPLPSNEFFQSFVNVTKFCKYEWTNKIYCTDKIFDTLTQCFEINYILWCENTKRLFKLTHIYMYRYFWFFFSVPWLLSVTEFCFSEYTCRLRKRLQKHRKKCIKFQKVRQTFSAFSNYILKSRTVLFYKSNLSGPFSGIWTKILSRRK